MLILNLTKMDSDSNLQIKLDSFAKYAWFVLAYNIVVILWGVVVRASLSGDGCGQYWLTCGGEIVPSAPELKTVIEFSHRLTSGLALVAVLAMCVWAFRKYAKGSFMRKITSASLVFIVIEALIGAILVLFKLVALNPSIVRAFSMAAHLINTFILLAVLTLTAWFASGGKPFRVRIRGKTLWFLSIAVSGILLISLSGSLAALSSTLFPAISLTEGLRQDFSETSHILLRLRISHPILSVAVGVFLIFLAGWFKSKQKENIWVNRWANALIILVFVQFASGALTLLTLAPIVMQLVHLLLADAVWIAFVLMTANVLAADENYLIEKIERNFSLETKSLRID
jgi:heme A synthase